MHDAASTSPPRQTSIFRMLFTFAYNRIWRGRFLVVAETILWSIIAAYFAFAIFQITTLTVDGIFKIAATLAFFIITPLIIGYAVLRAQVTVGTADSSLRNVPLTPAQIIFPRFLAVLLTWLQFVGPPVAVFIGYQLISLLVYNRGSPWVPSLFRYPPVNYVIAVFIIAGWGTLPASWGLWWGTRLQHRGGPFLLAYFAWLILPAAIIYIHYDIGKMAWAFPVTGAVGLVLSVVFFFLACRDWARRSG
jgi:hypothetical protein